MDKIEKIKIKPDSNIRHALQAIDKGGLGLSLIIDPITNRFIGLVTDGDIRRALLEGYGLESPINCVSSPKPKIARIGISIEQLESIFDETVHAVPLLDDKGCVADLAILDRRLRLPVAAPSLGERELQYLTECVLTGWISSTGKFVNRFEQMFASFCGTRYAIAASSGTTALHLALLALGIGPGDEVIVPTLTFIATANAVTYTGAKPIFADSEPETWNIDPKKLSSLITSRTRAIIPVHLYGHPADMDPILELAESNGFTVIEDAAEAHGASYKGKKVGSLGDAAIFSFYGNKIITTGEGGIVVTNRADIAERVKILRDHGMSPQRRYWHPLLGYNYRLTNLQAAIGVAQMEKVDDIILHKKRIAKEYKERLGALPGIHLPPDEPWADNVFWLYSILVNPKVFGKSRDELMAYLSKEGIETRPFFPPIHTQPIYNIDKHLIVAEQLSATGLSLPSAIGLRIEDIERVVDAMAKFRIVPR